MLDNPIPYKLKIDKYTGNKDSRKIVAKEGERIFVYSVERSDVYLARNSKGETFSVRAIDVQKI